jgi:threonine synthase
VIGWNPSARLVCMTCGHKSEIEPRYTGCSECADHGPIEVVYAPLARNGQLSNPESTARAAAALLQDCQPIDRGHLVDLGHGRTPLLNVPTLGAGVWLKNETVSATWSHKDRSNMISASAAKLFGAPGLVATSTGNHGASAAAYAAAAGIRSIVFCHPQAPPATVRMMRAFGGIPVKIDPEQQRKWVASLVDAGWLPSTSMDPRLAVRSNPYGVEGYKLIAYEILEQMGRTPGAVFIPSASGDTAYGILKGFREVTELTGFKTPRIVAAQPEGARALVLSLEAGHPVKVSAPDTIALSVGDAETGRPIIDALISSDGRAVAVSDDSIKRAVLDLGRVGVYAEPAGAVGLAAYRESVRQKAIGESEEVVLIVTASGAKWPEAMSQIVDDRVVTSTAELSRELQAYGPPYPEWGLNPW